MPTHTVGVFRRPDAAFAALRELDGLPPHHVGLIVAALYVATGGPSFSRDLVPVILGGAFVSFGLAIIGIVVGGALVVHTSHRDACEDVVKDGGAS